MSNAQVTIEKMQKRREFDLEIEPAKSDDEPAKKLRVRRPPEGEWQRAVTLDYVCKYVVGWSGFHERDMYAGGGADAVEFDSMLFRELFNDRGDWIVKCIEGVVAAMNSRADERKAASGN